MALAQRLRQVEKSLEKAGIRKQRITMIVVCESGVSEEQKREAIAEYEANNPDYDKNEINYVYVRNEQTKQLTEEVIAGKGTERSRAH